MVRAKVPRVGDPFDWLCQCWLFPPGLSTSLLEVTGVVQGAFEVPQYRFLIILQRSREMYLLQLTVDKAYNLYFFFWKFAVFNVLFFLIFLHPGVNTVTSLVESKKAQLVVIAHDVDPIEVSVLSICETSELTISCKILLWLLQWCFEFLHLNAPWRSK